MFMFSSAGERYCFSNVNGKYGTDSNSRNIIVKIKFKRYSDTRLLHHMCHIDKLTLKYCAVLWHEPHVFKMYCHPSVDL